MVFIDKVLDLGGFFQSIILQYEKNVNTLL